MSGNKNKLIAFNYFGGKFSLTEKLENLFPKHLHFIEVFGGSASLTLNKRPSRIETLNDVNDNVVNLFKVLRENPDKLISLLKLTPVARKEFNNSWDMSDCDEIEKARKFYVRIRQSFCGMGAQSKNKGWHMVKTKSNSNKGETISKWQNAIDKLGPVVHRLLDVQIENRCFRELIPSLDFENAFFYCDPPYHKEARCSFNDYAFEFRNKDHEDLSEILHAVKGKVMISGYDCPSMQKLYKGWKMVKFPIKFNNIRSSQVQECVWMNYDPMVESNQLPLFSGLVEGGEG